eukprot:764262-Hanusia_phi.AAC.5
MTPSCSSTSVSSCILAVFLSFLIRSAPLLPPLSSPPLRSSLRSPPAYPLYSTSTPQLYLAVSIGGSSDQVPVVGSKLSTLESLL